MLGNLKNIVVSSAMNAYSSAKVESRIKNAGWRNDEYLQTLQDKNE